MDEPELPLSLTRSWRCGLAWQHRRTLCCSTEQCCSRSNQTQGCCCLPHCPGSSCCMWRPDCCQGQQQWCCLAQQSRHQLLLHSWAAAAPCTSHMCGLPQALPAAEPCGRALHLTHSWPSCRARPACCCHWCCCCCCPGGAVPHAAASLQGEAASATQHAASRRATPGLTQKCSCLSLLPQLPVHQHLRCAAAALPRAVRASC